MNQIRTPFLPIILLGFLLGSFKGYLALWTEEDPEPFQIFPIAVSTLPEADQDALSEGIYARSELELNHMLEDFLS